MALYRGDTKVSGIGQSFNPENSGTEGQVLTKTNSGYAYCDSQGGGSSDTYNIKYLAVGGGGGGNGGKGSFGGGGGAVLYGKQGLNTDSISVSIGCGGSGCRCVGQNGGPTIIKNDEFIIVAKGGGGSSYGCQYCDLAQKYLSYSGNGFGNLCCITCCAYLGGGGAGGYADCYNGGPGLCGYGGGGATQTGTATDGGGAYAADATNCGGGGGSGTGTPYPGGNGAPGIVKICYACDGSGGINTATGGNSCYVCDGYCVHEFTSDGTFCITG